MPLRLALFLFLLPLPSTACRQPVLFAHPAKQSERIERQVVLMGTRASISLYTLQRKKGLLQVEKLIQILEKTDSQWSNWKVDSRISRLNQHPPGRAFPLEPDECRLFRALYYWHRLSGGAFDPAVSPLLEVWGVGDRGRIPSLSELAEAQAVSGLEHFNFSADACQVERPDDSRLDSGAFGKGEALDRAARYADLHNFDPWIIDLGGQVLVFRLPPFRSAWEVEVASPVDRRHTIGALRIDHGSLATSGSSERDLEVNGRRVGHIIDPRSGQPAAFLGSVLVWHQQALAADILSTALYVLGPERGVEWAERHDFAVAYLPSENSEIPLHSSRKFQQMFPEFRSSPTQ